MSQVVRGVMEAREFEARHEKAQALFAERCKTVDNVDGVLLMRVRPNNKNFSDQFAMTDPYGHDFGGDDYVAWFLSGRNKKTGFGREAPRADSLSWM